MNFIVFFEYPNYSSPPPSDQQQQQTDLPTLYQLLKKVNKKLEFDNIMNFFK
jgi:hypothetical protein